MKDERNAAFFADAYYRLTGEPGICLSTLGPGATNLVTGLANAYLDRSAVVAFTGQIDTKDMVKEYHQRLSVSQIVAPVTKWNFSIQSPDIIPESVRKAFKTAKTEKPGPVHVELPSDVMSQGTDAKPLDLLLYEPKYPPGGNLEIIEKAFNYIMAADFPIALVGNGVVRTNAGENLRKFVEKLNLPVISTYMGKGAIPEDHPLHLGVLGAFWGDVARQAIQRADVVVSFGYDFTELPADYWNSDGKRLAIHIDSTAAEIDRYYPVRYEIVGSINRTLLFMLKHKSTEPQMKRQRRISEIKELKKEFYDKFYPDDEGKALRPSRVVKILNETLSPDTIVTTDVGDHKTWMSRCLISRKPRKYLVSNGLAAMGFSLPAAIAAKMTFREAPVLCATGDGGFAMSFGELETVRRLELAFPILIFDNDALGQIYTKQRIAYGKRTIGVSFRNPDFMEIAKAFGLDGIKIEREDELKDGLMEAFASKRATLMDVKVDIEETLRIIRKLGSTRPSH
jgi:acetolactate synthase-1/2/3 large subunit